MRRHRAFRSGFAAVAILAAAFGFVSCDSGSSRGTTLAIGGGVVLTNYGSYSCNGYFFIYENGTSIASDTTVSINGQALTFGGAYFSGPVTGVQPGDTVDMLFSDKGTTASASIEAPGSVVIGYPTALSTPSASTPIIVSWTTTPGESDPGTVQIVISEDDTQSGTTFEEAVPNNGSYEIPANTLVAGQSVTITISGHAEAAPVGSGVMYGSMVSVDNSRTVTFTTTL